MANSIEVLNHAADNSRILAAADSDLAHQRTAAGDQHFILAHRCGPKAVCHLALAGNGCSTK